jgi:hypothetical protein
MYLSLGVDVVLTRSKVVLESGMMRIWIYYLKAVTKFVYTTIKSYLIRVYAQSKPVWYCHSL